LTQTQSESTNIILYHLIYIRKIVTKVAIKHITSHKVWIAKGRSVFNTYMPQS